MTHWAQQKSYRNHCNSKYPSCREKNNSVCTRTKTWPFVMKSVEHTVGCKHWGTQMKVFTLLRAEMPFSLACFCAEVWWLAHFCLPRWHWPSVNVWWAEMSSESRKLSNTSSLLEASLSLQTSEKWMVTSLEHVLLHTVLCLSTESWTHHPALNLYPSCSVSSDL